MKSLIGEKSLVSKKFYKKGGEKIMRKLVLVLLLVSLVSGITSALTTDSILLTVIPLINLSIDITADTTYYGSMNLGSSATIKAGFVANDGNVLSNWGKSASNTVGWTLSQSDPLGTDEFRLMAISTGLTQTPLFEDGGPQGQSVVDCGANKALCLFETGGVPDDLTEGADTIVSGTYAFETTRSLWVSIVLPSQVGSLGSGEQTVTVSVRAELP